MKLVYCWINNYLGIENQGFNFGSEYTYEHTLVDEVLSFERSKNENYIPDYFKTDGKGFENVTAIVGENGVGKSRLLKEILIHIEKKSGNNGVSLLIYEKDSNSIFISNKSTYTIKIFDSNLKNELKFEILESSTFSHKIVYYNPAFDFGDYFHYTNFDVEGNLLNTSPIYYLKSIDSISKSEENINKKVYYFNQVKRQISLVTKYNDFIKVSDLSFITSKTLKFDFQTYEGISTLNINFFTSKGNEKTSDNIKESFYNIYLKFKSEIESNKQNELYYCFFRSILTNYFKKIDTDKSTIISKILDLKPSYGLNKYIKNYLEILDFQSDKIDELFDFCVELNTNDFKESKEGYSLFIKYENLLKNFRIDNNDPLEISWEGLSSGELAILNFFANIHSIKHKTNDCKYLFFFIDEGELGFHVRWQQKYLDILIKGFSAMFQNDIDSPQLQLIFATHSPIVLSDMPKDHVVFLKKEKDNKTQILTGKTIINPDKTPKTFAANIHDILKHDFFMDNGFMGEHVKNKLNEVIYFLNCAAIDNSKEDPEKKIKKISQVIKNDNIRDFTKLKEDSFYSKKIIRDFIHTYRNIEIFISNIDEPILKIKLNEMYFMAKGDYAEKGRIEAQIQIMNDRLTELNKLNSNNDKN